MDITYSLRPWKFLAALCAVLLLAGGCTSLDEWQRRNIFQAESSARWGDNEPPAGGIAYDLALANGDLVHAWYVRAADADSPTLLFLHGARRNLSGSADRIELLRSLGFHVLAIDYRGFGRSTALLPSEASAIEDVDRAFAELKSKEPYPSKRFVYGYSLGGALAIDLAARENDFAGLVVEASFTRITDIVRESRYSWVPFIGLAVTQSFDSIDKIAHVKEPLLLVHGTADSLVPHTMSDRLYAAAVDVPPDLRRLLKVEGAGHRSAAFNGGAVFADALHRFTLDAQRAMAEAGTGARMDRQAATASRIVAAAAAPND
jgi:pimeloyl-ACP methyl ester carboxylesterase